MSHDEGLWEDEKSRRRCSRGSSIDLGNTQSSSWRERRDEGGKGGKRRRGWFGSFPFL